MQSLTSILGRQIVDSDAAGRGWTAYAAGSQDRRRRVYRMLRTWAALEPLIGFGTLICTDLILKVLVEIPSRSLSAVYRSARYRAWPAPGAYRNFAMIALVALVVLGLHLASLVLDLSYSQFYHLIRRQSYFTVFFLFNVIIVLDRLCSMFGVDLVGQALDVGPGRHPAAIVRDAIACVLYALVHIAILYLQIITINVAVNSHRGELIIVLTSNNFSEIKGGVLKKFSVVNLFQISMGDVVERFQTTAMIVAIAVHQLMAMDRSDMVDFCQRMVLVGAWMFFTESIVDWIKHGFINRFNNISPKVYRDFALLLSYDYLHNRSNIARRLGLVPLPIVAIVIRQQIRDRDGEGDRHDQSHCRRRTGHCHYAGM